MRHRQLGAEPAETGRRRTDRRLDGGQEPSGLWHCARQHLGPWRWQERDCQWQDHAGPPCTPGSPPLAGPAQARSTELGRQRRTPIQGRKGLGAKPGGPLPEMDREPRTLRHRSEEAQERRLGGGLQRLQDVEVGCPHHPLCRRRNRPSEVTRRQRAWDGTGWGEARGPAGSTHLTTDVTDGHMDKDGGLFHPLQVHMPIA